MIGSLTTMRHSLTAHNLAQIITGRLDEPLSEAGRSLAANAPNIRADMVVSSPSLRALETAVLVTGRQPAKIRVSPLCCERSYGELEGLDRHQIAKYRSRIHYLRVGDIEHSLNPPGGETFDQVYDRAQQFVSFLCGLETDSVLVVSHEVFLQQLHRVLLGADLSTALAREIRPLQTHCFARDRDTGRWSPRQRAAQPGVAEWIPW